MILPNLQTNLRPAATLLLAGLLAACGAASGTFPTLEAATPAAASPTALPPTPQPILTPGAIHPVLLELEAGVEAVFIHVPAGDWEAAAADLEAMTAAWYEHGEEVALAGAAQATLNSLDAALADAANRTAAQDANGALQAANLASAAVADLYDLYLPPPSGDLRRLAMLERQLWLDAAAGDFQVIQGDFAQLQSIWERIAPQIRSQGGDAFADQFEASLAAQAGLIEANDAPGLQAETSRGAQLVGLLR